MRTAVIAGAGLSLVPGVASAAANSPVIKGKKAGIIGLDTSHSIAFTKTLNDPAAGPEFGGYRVVAAYPQGSKDIESSVSRIPAYIDEVKQHGVEIAGSIEELLDKVDVVLLETNDGRPHLEQALLVFKAGKRMFIDKPVAASLTDALDIFAASEYYNVPVFSSSSLRYVAGAKEIKEGKIGKVLGAETYSPAKIEMHHPDLFWYGIHGVEILFTLMGLGCRSVMRIHTDDTDIAVGKWQDDRIGTFRGLRSGALGYGGTAFGEKGIEVLGNFEGYNSLLVQIIEFFETGIVPVTPEETIEIYTFMEAADESRLSGGVWVDMETVLQRARNSKDRLILMSDIKSRAGEWNNP